MRARTVFMGSPEFALPSLEALHRITNLVGVVTQPDRPAGRGRTLASPAVKEYALRLGLPVIQPRRLSSPDAFSQLQAWSPDIIVVAAFGQILKPAVLELPPFGCLNVHASLLPRWRGAAPIQAAILHGDSQTGITIMQMDPGLDTGPIVSQEALVIRETDTGGSLSARLARLGAELLQATLPAFLSGTISPQPQNEGQASYAPLLKKQDGELDLQEPAAALARRVRAFSPWPGTYTMWKGQPLKIQKARPLDRAVGADGLKPGDRAIHEGLPALVTQDGLLLLEQVQPAGKKPLAGSDFLRGARDWERP